METHTHASITNADNYAAYDTAFILDPLPFLLFDSNELQLSVLQDAPSEAAHHHVPDATSIEQVMLPSYIGAGDVLAASSTSHHTSLCSSIMNVELASQQDTTMHVSFTRAACHCRPKQRVARFAKTAVAVLMQWLTANIDNPYPTKEQKSILTSSTNLSAAQIDTWFQNARRRYIRTNKCARCGYCISTKQRNKFNNKCVHEM